MFPHSLIIDCFRCWNLAFNSFDSRRLLQFLYLLSSTIGASKALSFFRRATSKLLCIFRMIYCCCKNFSAAWIHRNWQKKSPHFIIGEIFYVQLFLSFACRFIPSKENGSTKAVCAYDKIENILSVLRRCGQVLKT